MKITWLGQAGLFIETCGLKIMIDPYLSDSVGKVNPANARRVPVDERWFSAEPDVLIFTHNHLDHTDPETYPRILDTQRSIFVMAPEAAWTEVRKCKGPHNYIRFNRHSEFTVGDVRFRAVKAEHSDPHPIGVLIEAEGKTLYVTGDTLYNTDIFDDIPFGVDAVFLPVNGLGNNMNMTDAKRFCEKIGAKTAVPMHCGLFDAIDMHDFSYAHTVVPEFFKEIPIF